MLQTGRIEFSVLDFLDFDLFWPRFVSDFDIRISDLPLQGLFRSAGPLWCFGFQILRRVSCAPALVFEPQDIVGGDGAVKTF